MALKACTISQVLRAIRRRAPTRYEYGFNFKVSNIAVQHADELIRYYCQCPIKKTGCYELSVASDRIWMTDYALTPADSMDVDLIDAEFILIQ